MQTLLDLLPLMKNLGKREAIRFCSGFRTRQVSYRELYYGIGGAAHQVGKVGLQRGDRVLLWGENRPEWLIVFWACLLRGVQVVPLDAQSSLPFVTRVQAQVKAKLLVHGNQIAGDELNLPAFSYSQVRSWPQSDLGDISTISASEIVEIVFTSGTTGTPRGVIQRHRNICANLAPLEREIRRYRKWAWPFQPIRILNLLPLSHMYGQSLGTFVPLLLGGSVVFSTTLNPTALLQTIRRERVTVLVAVPALARKLQQRLQYRLALPDVKVPIEGSAAALRRWWHYRRVHSALGWKFWAIVIGGASLDPRIEVFWRDLGFLVLQGYGLTETSPLVTATHPMKVRPGSIGKPLPGLEVRIAPDGEILVRGESVSDECLGSEPGGRTSAQGWFHTGDLGHIDGEGWLYFRGRKQDLIVTPEGLNVYPREVESILNNHPQIRDSVIIPLRDGGEEGIHAVVIPNRREIDMEELMADLNRQLEPHQRPRGWSIWPDEDFPRTASTLKVQRHQVAERISREPELTPSGSGSVERVLASMLGEKAQLNADHRLHEDLGLSSLDQVELLSRLEDRLGVALEEEDFTRLSTVGEVKQWLHAPDGTLQGLERPSATAGKPSATTPPDPPRWSHLAAVEITRRAALNGLILPLFGRYVRLEVKGREHLDELGVPVIFAANHVSHLDTLAVLAALPQSWRARLAPAMSWDYFRGPFQAGARSGVERLMKVAQYYAACVCFRAYPISQQREGVRGTLRYSGWLMDHGGCPLLYPEGRRSTDGRLRPFQNGIGYMALRLEAPVVPIYLQGMYEIYSVHHRWPKAGQVGVQIGPALHFGGKRDHLKVTRLVEQQFRSLQANG